MVRCQNTFLSNHVGVKIVLKKHLGVGNRFLNAARTKDIAKMRGAFPMSVEDFDDTASYTTPQAVATTTALADRLGGRGSLFSQGPGTTANVTHRAAKLSVKLL